MQIVSSLRLNGNTILDFGIQALAAAPNTNLYAGRAYYDTVGLGIRFYNGATWDNKATDSALLGGQSSSYHLNRVNHTGTQLAATISNLAATVQGYTLNQFTAPTANVAMGGFNFSALAQPTAAGQAAEYSWVLNQIASATSGIKAVKDPVRAYLSSNVATNGIPTQVQADGVTLVAGDRVLAANQTTGSQNQIWEVRAGAWTQPVDFDQSTDIEPGTEVLVQEGTTYGGAIFRISTTGTLTLGTTSLSWTQVNKINTYSAGNGLSLTGFVFAVVAAPGGGLTVGGSGVAVDRTVVPNRAATTVGDAASSSFNFAHNLNTLDVQVTVREISTGNLVYPDVTVTSVNQITVAFGVTVPAANSYRIVCIG